MRRFALFTLLAIVAFTFAAPAFAGDLVFEKDGYVYTHKKVANAGYSDTPSILTYTYGEHQKLGPSAKGPGGNRWMTMKSFCDKKNLYEARLEGDFYKFPVPADAKAAGYIRYNLVRLGTCPPDTSDGPGRQYSMIHEFEDELGDNYIGPDESREHGNGLYCKLTTR